MLGITKRILISSLCLSLLALTACKKKGDINAKIYSNNKAEDLYGTFYTTEFGGLNYYITNEEQRDAVFSMNNIDSLVFYFNDENYVAKPLLRQSFSRDRSNSDFSFFIDKESHKIVVDTVKDLKTILLFSEKTDLEKLKEEQKIKFNPIESN